MNQQEEIYLESLQQLRQQLDTIDQEIIELLIRRFKITDEVGVLKSINKKTVVDMVRENEVLENIKLKIWTENQRESNENTECLATCISEIYKVIMAQSKLKQEMMFSVSQKR